MKIKFYKYFGVILAFLAISCEADRAMPEQNNTFTLEQAKHFHMEHATDLRLPGMDGGSVKSSIDYNEILVPQWDKATYHEAQFPSKLARTYEVPLNTGSIVGGVLLKENATEHDVVTMKSSLIIQEFSQGEKTSNRQMVVTVLGKVSDNNNQTEAFSYMGSHKDFTGFMVVSTLEGEIVNIFQYLCGQRSVVYIRKTDDAPINAPLSGFSFLKAQGTKSSYGNSEPGFCYMCGKEGMVYIQYGHICESCLEGSELLDGIVVTDKPSYCDKCGRLESECVCNPFACPICGYEPCQCDDPDGRCEYCGEIGCNGECSEGGKGGGGSDGEPAEGEWSNNGHKTIITNALGDLLTSEQLNAVIKGSQRADRIQHQGTKSAYMHAMVPVNGSYEETINKMRNHFVQYMGYFKDSNNFEQFGMGIHGIQDAYCPIHDFNEWNCLSISDWLKHNKEDADDYPQDAKGAEDATKSIYEEVKKSDGSSTSLANIFNKWLEDFENEKSGN